MMRKIVRLLMRHDGLNFRASCNYEDHHTEFVAVRIVDIELQVRQYLKRNFKLERVLLAYDYDISSIFQHGLINISALARYTGIEPGLLRQFAAGTRNPKGKELDKLLKGFYMLASRMDKISLAVDGRSLLSSFEI